MTCTLSQNIQSINIPLISRKTGGATVVEPQKGWNNTDLATLFKNKHAVSSGDQTKSNNTTSSTFTATPSGNSSGSISKGGIAGAVVGSVAGAAAIGGLAFFLITYIRRRNAKQQQANDTPFDGKRQMDWAELHGNDRPHELATAVDIATEMPARPTKEEPRPPPQELPADTNISPQPRS